MCNKLRFNLDVACFTLGAVTFLISATMSSAAIAYIVMEEHRKTGPMTLTEQPTDPMIFNIQKPATELVLGIVLVIGVLWMLFSVAFLHGIKKSKPSFVVSYFLFGVAISVIALVTAMLELVGRQWPIAVATLIITVLYMQCLRIVYSAYDNLLQGKSLGDQEQLILDEEFSVGDD